MNRQAFNVKTVCLRAGEAIPRKRHRRSGRSGVVAAAVGLIFLGLWAAAGRAVTCTTQAEMRNEDRNAIVAAVKQLALQVQTGNVAAVQAVALPAVAAQFQGISTQVLGVAPSIAGAALTVEDLYLLDASDLTRTQDQTEFYCGGQDSPDVSFSIAQIPPGRYALAFVHATGVARPQQMSFLLAQPSNGAAGSSPKTTGASATASTASTTVAPSRAGDPSASSSWRLAGFFVRPLTSAGRDGLWYWTKARDFAKSEQDWNAYFYYQTAASLLVPVDFLSSPNLDKLIKEQTAVAPADLPGAQPMTVAINGHSYAVSALRTEGSLGGLDLVISYQGTDNSDPVAARTRNIEVMRAMLNLHPELKKGFHGLWVYSIASNQRSFANEMPMNEIQ